MKLSIHAQDEFTEVRAKMLHSLDILEQLESMYHQDGDKAQEAIVQQLHKLIVDTLTDIPEIRSFEDGLKLYKVLEVSKLTVTNLA